MPAAPLLPAALVVAVVAAARSTWSPCGWSVLSTMTPLAERRRGHRFAATATWYVLGALLGGLCLGLPVAAVAALLGAADVPRGALVALAGAACLGAAAGDTALLPAVAVPGHRRQVNEDWLELYRPSVYALGFGWQIGSGLATYLRTATVYAMIVLAALTASPVAALAVPGLFGLVRGLAILAARRCVTQARVLDFHRRFAAADGSSREVTAAVTGLLGLLLLAVLAPSAGVVAALLLAVAAAVAPVARWRTRRRQLAPQP